MSRPQYRADLRACLRRAAGDRLCDRKAGCRRTGVAAHGLLCRSLFLRRVLHAARGDRQPSDEEVRSEEHTSELQSLMRISYAVFCLKKKNQQIKRHTQYTAISVSPK